MTKKSPFLLPITEACKDPNLFRPWFKTWSTWRSWRVFLRAAFGLGFMRGDRELYEKCTGRTDTPRKPFKEVILIIGRRAGKSFILALIAVYLAFFRDWRPYLVPGEKATILVIAADRRQARVIFRYIDALIHGIPWLQRKVIFPTRSDNIRLVNDVVIEIHTASFRAVRGYTVVAALMDELAFWRDEKSANPDTEVLEAIRPGMARIEESMLLCASSPYVRKGAIYKFFNDYYGKNDPDVLVWHTDTRVMNPTIPQKYIDKQYERDPVAAATEWGAQFRADIEDFVPEEVVDAAIPKGCFEIPFVRTNNYRAFADPSGGSRDSFTLAIGHVEEGDRVLDALREWRPPFSPDAVVKECTELLRVYGLSTVMGDNYAGLWPKERFQHHGCSYKVCKIRKSDLYRDSLPVLNTGKIRLLDNLRMKTQMVSLERRAGSGGKFTIDHPPGGHDDLANAVLGLMATIPVVSVEYDESDVIISQPLVSSHSPLVEIGEL